ncbi:MAG: tetratricopeptide repeat protein, partial [Gemmataceae bacterium]
RDLEDIPSLGLGVYLERGKWANLSGRPEEAERAYRKALEVDPSSSDACRGLAASLKRAGKSEESETYRRRADELERDVERLYQIRSLLGKQPDDMKARFEAAQICLRNGQKAEARRWLESILRLRPDHQPSLEALKQCD